MADNMPQVPPYTIWHQQQTPTILTCVADSGNKTTYTDIYIYRQQSFPYRYNTAELNSKPTDIVTMATALGYFESRMCLEKKSSLDIPPTFFFFFFKQHNVTFSLSTAA